RFAPSRRGRPAQCTGEAHRRRSALCRAFRRRDHRQGCGAAAMTVLDRRLHAFRPDLADARLQGQVEAKRYVAGRLATVTAHVADMRRQPRPDAGLDTQLLFGDDVEIFDESEGWVWVQSRRDGYVGYVADTALGAPASVPTHTIAVPRTFLYP